MAVVDFGRVRDINLPLQIVLPTNAVFICFINSPVLLRVQGILLWEKNNRTAKNTKHTHTHKSNNIVSLYQKLLIVDCVISNLLTSHCLHTILGTEFEGEMFPRQKKYYRQASIIRHRPSTFSNDISEAMKPIRTIFHI